MPTLHPFASPTPRLRPARRIRIAAALAAAGVASLAGTLAVPASGAAATLQAAPASSFRDSIGVQTHFGFTGYAYDTASTGELSGLLRTLGVRHLRDDLCFNSETACTRIRSRLASMQDALGAGAPKVDLMAGYTRELASVSDRTTRDADIQRALTAAINSPLAPMVAALEPVNEPDLKNSINWIGATLGDDDTFQRLLAQPQYAALRNVPHLSPPIGHVTNTPQLLGGGWTKSRADIGNFHPYPPAWGGPENGLDTACGTTTAFGCAQQLGEASAPIATESGYTTSGNLLSTSWVSEKAQGIYMPRLLLENFRRGVARTYLYELVDLKPSTGSSVEGYGLWRSKATSAGYTPSTIKPAGLAVSRMNATIGDLGTAASPGALDVSIRANGKEVGDDTIRRVLLHRADGSYVLALWQPKAVWNNTYLKQSDVTVPEISADVTIGGATWTATATRPSLGDAATGEWTGTSQLSLPIGADVTLLELRADGAAPATTPAPAPATVTVPAPPTTTGKVSAVSSKAAAQAAAWQVFAKLVAAALARSTTSHKATRLSGKTAKAKAARARAAKAKRSKAKRAKAARAKRSSTSRAAAAH